MQRVGPNERCPCGSGEKLKRCCRPLHRGQPAASAEALMRSRYSAYALGAWDYIVETTDPEGPQFQPERTRWLAEVEAFGRGTDFLGLEVLAADEFADEAQVTFRATLRQGEVDASFSERSRFRRRAGRWLYHSGVHPE